MVRDESDRYGVGVNLGKYVFILIFGTCLILLLIVYSILENQQLRKEIDDAKKANEATVSNYEADLKSIYVILAQQSSNMRTIMNVGITNSHWSKHVYNRIHQQHTQFNNPRLSQHDCPECMAIYKQIQDQREKLSLELGYERANVPLAERLQAPKTALEKEGADNADKQGRGN